jgi:dienelactone hydrolase
MRTAISFLTLLPLVLAQKGSYGSLPAKGDNGQMGGIFGMGGISLGKIGKSAGGKSGGMQMGSLLATGSESPKGKNLANPNDPGTGEYPAHMVSDPTLPGHTIYAPKSPPSVKMPVIVWGNGGCIANGASFQGFLTEIASHGYLVVANGASGAAAKGGKGSKAGKAKASGGLLSMLGGSSTQVSDLVASINWVEKGLAAKYGNIDATKIAAAGQSCGGLEAYSASYHETRVKLTVLFNSGLLDDQKTYLLKELKAPVAYFLGGPKDIAYANVYVSYIYELPS